MIENIFNMVIIEIGRFVTFTVAEQIEGITRITVESQGREQIIPIKKRGGQPVDQDDWRALALLRKIDVIFKQGGIVHTFLPTRAAELCQ